ncbi:MAG: hypothetical protein IPJ76_11925 [Flavobacteriales bacterium]|nr:MAG: hypothetical protein IPJ76_11925 [Flavobacteriales bacterium]
MGIAAGPFYRFRKWWRALGMQKWRRLALAEERRRLTLALGRSVQAEPKNAQAEAFQQQSHDRLLRLDRVHGELLQEHVMRLGLFILAVAIVVVVVFSIRREERTPFQVSGRFSAVLFRTTATVNIQHDEGAWMREAQLIFADTSWSHTRGTPFPLRGELDLLALDEGPVQLSDISIPAGTIVRLQDRGNAWALVMEPPAEHREELRIHILREKGTIGVESDTLLRFPHGVELVAASGQRHTLQMTRLQLELPCLPVDSVLYITAYRTDPDEPVRSSVLEASLSTASTRDEPLHLAQHDTLVTRSTDVALLCLKIDSAGLRVTHTGEAGAILAGRRGMKPGQLDQRSRILTAWLGRIPPDLLTYGLSILVSALVSIGGYFALRQRRA